MTLDHDTIQALLPHRPPILLPHQLEIHTPGVLGVGRVNLDLDARLWGEWQARDLFAELVLEAAAQVLGLVMAATPGADSAQGHEGRARRHLLLGFAGVEFADAIAPLAEFAVEAAVVHRMGTVCRGRFSAHHNGLEIARGELTVMQG